MITIKFLKHEKSIIGFECMGHAEYAEYGKDVVCSAISSIMQSGALGISKVLKVQAKIDRDDKLGKFNLTLPKNITPNQLEKAQIIFETIKVSVLDLTKGYSKYIKVEE